MQLNHPLIEILNKAAKQHGVDVDFSDLSILSRKWEDKESFDEGFLYNILRKLDIEVEGVDPEQNALDKFLQLEKRTRALNKMYSDEFRHSDGSHRLFNYWRNAVHRLCQLRVFTIKPRLTSGAGISFKRGGSAIEYLNERTPITKNLRDWLLSKEILHEDPLFRSNRAKFESREIAEFSELMFVPKQWNTHRSIELQPKFALTWQCGLADYFAAILDSIGNSTRTGNTRHRELAWEGSMFKTYATIDLTSAGESIPREAARLFPHEIMMWLRATRMEHIRINGTVSALGSDVHETQMLAGSGNGYQFTMETILFYTLIHAAIEITHDKVYDIGSLPISVYGDDIIVKDDYADVALRALRAMGFMPNMDKTFYGSHGFRESVGAEFFNGEDVRAFNIKKLPTTLMDWFGVCNRIYDRCRDYGKWRSPFYETLWTMCVSHIEPTNRFGGPEYLGDTVLHGCDPIFTKHGRFKSLAPAFDKEQKYSFAKAVRLNHLTWYARLVAAVDASLMGVARGGNHHDDLIIPGSYPRSRINTSRYFEYPDAVGTDLDMVDNERWIELERLRRETKVKTCLDEVLKRRLICSTDEATGKSLFIGLVRLLRAKQHAQREASYTPDLMLESF